MLTTDVENYPGFPDGILGPELMMKFREQAERFGAEFITADADRVDLSGGGPFGVWVGEREFRARSMVITTGASARMLGLPAEQRLLGHGVSTCATCDGFFFREKPIAVVGGGDSAIEEAIFLTKFATTVTLVHRRDELRASKIMRERALKNEKIRFVWNAEIAEVIGEEHKRVTAVKLRDTSTGAITEEPIDGVFIAIGHQPNTDFLGGQLETDAKGYLKVKPGTSYTNVEGVFAAGDVHDTVYRQAVTAAGSGCMAAIDAERWLEAKAHEEHAAGAAH
jgi:thioredoxin reductase (NADPH)